MLVEIDMGQGRTGVTRPERRCAARAPDRGPARSSTTAASRPITAICSTCRPTPSAKPRRPSSGRGSQPFLDALSAAGLAPEIVSGGGTGTHQLDLEDGPFTEIQPGSYLFMDKQYGAIELAPGGAPFATALTVAARVISVNQPDLR